MRPRAFPSSSTGRGARPPVRRPSGRSIRRRVNPLRAHTRFRRGTDIEDALEAGARAALELARSAPSPSSRSSRSFAGQLEGRRDELVAAAHLETALPAEPRLRHRSNSRVCSTSSARRRPPAGTAPGAGPRSTSSGTSAPCSGRWAVRWSSWDRTISPIAYNAVGGGDFASALAAGNPVIAKAHPGHPATTRLLAEAALEALGTAGLPSASVQLLYHFAPEDGLRLVAHPTVARHGLHRQPALGDGPQGGRRPGGKAHLPRDVERQPRLHPLPGALEERPEEIAGELFQSCTLAAGQMCTKPGLVVVAGWRGRAGPSLTAGQRGVRKLGAGHPPRTERS